MSASAPGTSCMAAPGGSHTKDHSVEQPAPVVQHTTGGTLLTRGLYRVCEDRTARYGCCESGRSLKRVILFLDRLPAGRFADFTYGHHGEDLRLAAVNSV